MKGRLNLRGDHGYEQAPVGRIFNARRPGRYPAAVLKVVDSQEVAAVVEFAAVPVGNLLELLDRAGAA